MKTLTFLSIGVAAGLAFAAPASAAVVCNDDGDCWKVKKTYKYKPEFRLKVYEDDWRWADRDRARYRWRDGQDGPGYWRKGVWITF